MKRSVFLGLMLFVAAVSQMFAAPDMRLTLVADGAPACNIDVTGGVATVGAGCGTLTAIVSGPSHGQLIVNGDLGNYRVSDTANGFNAAVFPALQDLNQLDVECAPNPTAARCNSALGVGGTFSATFTDTSLTTVTNAFQASISIVAGTTSDVTGSVNYKFFSDASNSIPATANLIASATLTGPNDSATLIGPQNPPGAPLYSLTTIEKLNFNHNGSIQANAEISAVPEPASIMLTGTMLLFTSIGLRRKLRRG